jgi:hypothetical protein
MTNVKFDKGVFPDMDFMKCKLKDVSFVNCSFKEIRITNAKTIENLLFDNTQFDKIVIDQSPFQSIQIFTSETDTVKSVLIQNCNNSDGIIFSGNFKEIILEGGQINNLDITDIRNSDCQITVISTSLVHPNLFSNETKQPSVFFNASLENAQFSPDNESILAEEFKIDELSTKESYSTERTSIKKKYITVRTAYNHLSKIFGDQKKYDMSDYFDFRSKVCDRKLKTTRFRGFLSYVFHEKMRGNYGTSSITVLKTMLDIFLFFTLVYFLLGFFNYSFGFYINTKFSGEHLENEKPTLITLRHNITKLLSYIKHCFVFSLNQMILGGISRDFHIYDFSVWFLFPPRKYGAIGIGRYISLVQNIVGLMMLFFLITAFLKLNR